MPDRKDNSGALFKNGPERKSEYGGSCVIDGREYWINAWVKESKQGKFFSLSFRAKDPQPQPKPRDDAWGMELDDEIPF